MFGNAFEGRQLTANYRFISIVIVLSIMIAMLSNVPATISPKAHQIDTHPHVIGASISEFHDTAEVWPAVRNALGQSNTSGG